MVCPICERKFDVKPFNKRFCCYAHRDLFYSLKGIKDARSLDKERLIIYSRLKSGGLI